MHDLEYYCTDALGNTMALENETDSVDDRAPAVYIHNPTRAHRENVDECSQSIVVTVYDEKSGVNDESVRAELWGYNEFCISEGLVNDNPCMNKVRELDLTKNIFSSGSTDYSGVMDKQLPVGNYELRIIAEDNLGNSRTVSESEYLSPTFTIESISPTACVINPGQNQECDFTYNVCMRGDNSMQFWMNKLAEKYHPKGDLNASISGNGYTTDVGIKHDDNKTEEECDDPYANVWDAQTQTCWYIQDGGILQLGPDCEDINNRTSFDLHLELTPDVTMHLGEGAHKLEYWIETSLQPESCTIEQ